MKSIILSKWPLLIFIIAGIMFSAIIIFFPLFNLLGQNSYVKPVLPIKKIEQKPIIDKPTKIFSNLVLTEPASPGIPLRLKIPKIKVDSTLESVGLTVKGEVGIPKGPISAAWFNLSPRPGNNGNAVITGHYGVWKGGLPTVFNNLYKLNKGDKIYVKDDKGATTTFVVRELRTYDLKTNASEVFISKDGKAHLNLITCEGIWNKKSKSYSQRLVVFTDKVE